MVQISQVEVQVGYAVLLYLSILICFLLPNKLLFKQTEHGSNQLILSYSNCVSAGIFIAICFLGLFPLVAKEFDQFFEDAKITNVDYPVSQLVILIGFFLVLAFEQFIINWKEKKKPPVLYLDDKVGEQTHHLLDDLAHKSGSNNSALNDNSIILTDHNLTYDNQDSVAIHSHHGHSHKYNLGSNSKEISIFMLAFASSIHSVFEGLALGLIKNTITSIHLFLGILLHECIMAFALGINSIGLSNQFKLGSAFASTVPIGIILGLILNTASGLTGKLIASIFQGLAAGTFIHVAFFELLPSELLANQSGSTKLFKIFLTFAGFVFMALISLIAR